MATSRLQDVITSNAGVSLTTTNQTTGTVTVAGATVTSGTTPAYGSYTQLFASTTTKVNCIQIQFTNANSSEVYMFQLAIGAAASEVVIWSSPRMSASSGATGTFTYTIPVTIAASTRIAVSAATGTNSSKTMDIVCSLSEV